MYNKIEAIRLPETKAEYLKLIKLCTDLTIAYNHGQSSLSDSEYDHKYAILQMVESQHPDWVVSFSPTQCIIANVDREKAIRHLSLMKSLSYKHTEEEVLQWLTKLNIDLSKKNLLWAEPKLDGISLEAIYNHGHLQCLSTRGTGDIGSDITRNCAALGNLPLTVSIDQEFAVYGEGVWPNGINLALQTPAWNYDTPRNGIAGMLQRNLIPKIAYGKFKFIAYNTTLRNPNIRTQEDIIHVLSSLGFETCKPTTLCDFDIAVNFFNYIETHRQEFQCDLDGIVLKINDLAMQQQVTDTVNSKNTRHPSYAVSWKFKPQCAVSMIEAVTWQIGRSGQLCPITHITPINIGGTTISKISLSNLRIIKEKNLHLGDSVEIARLNDVIPYIVKTVTTDADKAHLLDIQFPTACPFCNGPLTPSRNTLFCYNRDCPAINIGKITWFFSKKCVYVRGLSVKNIETLIKKTGAKDPIDFFTIPLHSYQYCLGNKVGTKIYRAMCEMLTNNAQNLFPKILIGLGIPQISEKTVLSIVENGYGSLTTFLEGLKEKFNRLPNKKTRLALTNWFSEDNHMDYLYRLQKIGIQ